MNRDKSSGILLVSEMWRDESWLPFSSKILTMLKKLWSKLSINFSWEPTEYLSFLNSRIIKF